MITNTGKQIFAKYLIGQAPAYASHIAVGCGAKPVETSAGLTDYSAKQVLDFEMFRAPIISRGYVQDGDQTKIIFTAELPTQERFEITEIGLYSAGSNPSISGYDSRVLYSFSRQEEWRYDEELLPVVDLPLDNNNASNDIDPQTSPVFQTNASNKIFANLDRQKRQEQCRYLNNMVMIKGDFSSLDAGEIDLTSNFISIASTAVNIEKNSPTDLMKIAFSIVNVDGSVLNPTVIQPDSAKIVVQFLTPGGQSATLNVTVSSTALGGTANFATNRYFVVSAPLSQIQKTAGFFWSQVNTVKIFSAVIKDGAVSNEFYLALDAIRLDNVTSINPIYGMTGYSVVVNQLTDGSTTYPAPIVKLPNTSSLIEFRLGIDI